MHPRFDALVLICTYLYGYGIIVTIMMVITIMLNACKIQDDVWDIVIHSSVLEN